MLPRIAAAAILAAVAAGPAAADVVIGVAGPMSGAFAPVGAEMEAGVRVMADRLNGAGGLDGETVVVEAVDDECNAAAGEAVANQLVGRGAALVVGHACTAAALPAARVYDRAGIVFITPAATNPRLTDETVGPGVFRLAPRSDAQSLLLGRHLADRYPGGRVAFVHDGSVYGQAFAEGVRAAFEAEGESGVATLAFTPGERSQNALVGQIQDAIVSAVVIGGLHADAAVIAGEMRARGLDAAIFGSEALGLDEFRDLAGAAAEGVVFTLPSDPSAASAAAVTVAALREAAVEPTAIAVRAAAAVEVYAAARVEAGTDAFRDIASAISAGRFETSAGEIGFDRKGDTTAPGWSLAVWRDGAPVPLP